MNQPTNIHPTAVVHPSVKLGEGVEVGPYCVLHEGVEIGDRCWLQNHVTLCGPSRIGADNRFHAFASVGQRSQDLKYEGEPTHLEIGDRNTFREFVTVNRGTSPGSTTRIGSHGHFLAYCHIAHDCQVGDYVIFSNNGTLAGHVEVGDHVVIGGLTAIHQYCRIGAHAITGGCSKIVQDVPPYMIADGNPAVVRGVNHVGLQRRGFADETVRRLREAHRQIWRGGKNTSQALEELRTWPDPDQALGLLIDFIAGSQRGIIR